MKKYFLLLAGLIGQLLSLNLFAQKTAHTEAALNAHKSLLWRVTGKGLKKPSYIFGTIHMICEEDYFFTSAMQEAFQKSDRLVLEIDLSDPASSQSNLSLMLLPEGRTLRDFFSTDERYQSFAEKFKEQSGFELNQVKQMKPLAILSILLANANTCVNTASYEMKLMKMGEGRHMPVKGLETTDAQMAIFDRMTAPEIEALLMESVGDPKQAMGEQQKMIEHYKAQDVESLYKLITASPEFKGHEGQLINDRNQAWVKILPAWFIEASCFVAVGAGHLSGASGVLNLLRHAGYQVEAVH
ncbi:MAG: TraB/GumN family protein [Chitinophagaceae bacterium]|nr:TraB/GumN family protein [Chitinophagaceae bacterium]